MGITESLKDKVNTNIAEVTALAVSPATLAVTNEMMEDEIRTTHLNQMGQMAIESVIDKNRAIYEGQLDDIQDAVSKASKALAKAEADLAREIDHFKQNLVKTELRKKRAARLAYLNSQPDLEQPYEAIEGDDEDEDGTVSLKGFELNYLAPNKDMKDPAKRGGGVSWKFKLRQRGDSSYASGNRYAGFRARSAKLGTLHDEVDAIKKDIEELTETNRAVRNQIQRLERKRREMQAKLRESILSKSVVGTQIEKLVADSCDEIPQLVLPKKYAKK